MRFTVVRGEWTIYHGELVVGYGSTLDSIKQGLFQFLDYPLYSKEVVFWRIKIDGNQTELVNELRSSFGPYLVDNPSLDSDDSILSSMKLTDIWSQNPSKGNLVLLSYQWKPAPVEPRKRLGWIWSYESAYLGRYSDATYFPGVMTKCAVGQQVRLTSYKNQFLGANINSSRPIFGLWWTFTGGNIAANTQYNWINYTSPFKDFYVRNDGEIGNIIVSDFIGSYDFMTYVMMYNKNKYATFPPISPIEGLSISQKDLPGWDLVPNANGTCDDTGDDDAGRSLFNQAIGLLVGVSVGGLLIIGCCVTCLALWLTRKPKDGYDTVD
jgi:hypothetical protein